MSCAFWSSAAQLSQALQLVHTRRQGPSRLSLLQAVADPTGKEDLLAALRKALLLRLAAQLGCNKVAIGTSATRIAVRTVAMSAKGSGFGLSGAIHFTDSRSAHALQAQRYSVPTVCTQLGPDAN